MDEFVDLVDDRSLTVALLADPLAWRVRAVEHIEIDGAYSCARRRSLQCGPLREVLSKHDEPARIAFLVVNVASVPRGPLLDFDVAGPLGPAFLLPRQEVAARQALFISKLAASALVPVSEAGVDFLAAAFGMPLYAGDSSSDPTTEEIEAHLADGLADEGGELYKEWIAISRKCAAIIDQRLDRPSPRSPTRLPVLAVPEYVGGAPGVCLESVTDVLKEYWSLLSTAVTASRAEEPTVADELLASIADYGDNYDLMVATKVPLDEPFMLTYSERRSMALSLITGTGAQDLVVADAITNHVAVQTKDPSVEIRSVQALNPSTSAVAYGAFAVRDTRQFWSCYAHGSDRDYRMELNFRVRPLRRLTAVPYALAGFLILIAVAIWREQVQGLGDLALIVGPSALAASLLLAREQTTLGSRLRLPTSVAVTAALLALLSTAVALYAGWSLSDLVRSIQT